MNYYIGIDLGTSSCKGILTDPSGAIIREYSEDYNVSYPVPGWSEQDPADWLKAAKTILKKLGSGLENDVRGVAIAGQMHGLVMLDGDDNVIRPAILWNDGRSDAETAYLNSLPDLTEMTGNIAFAGFTAPKILWVKKNEPGNFARARKICLPKDYVAYKLTGVFSTEPSDAAGMLLMDVKKRCWSERMCALCGITSAMLPEIYESWEVTGRLDPSLGFPNAFMCAGAGDNAAAAVGTGTISEGDCSISLGTSGTVFLPVSGAENLPGGDNSSGGETASVSTAGNSGGVLHLFAHASGGLHLMGCILSAASCNKWWTKEILETGYDLFSDEKAGENRVWFLPYLTGERCPHNDVNARGAFIGLSADTTKDDMSLAVFEGVAYALRDCIEAGGVSVRKAVLSGGGAGSEMWRRILAGVLGADLYMSETAQGPSFGAAILAMTGMGEYASVAEAAGRIVKKKLVTACEPALREKYDRGYGIYRQLYPALRDIFARMNGR